MRVGTATAVLRCDPHPRSIRPQRDVPGFVGAIERDAAVARDHLGRGVTVGVACAHRDHGDARLHGIEDLARRGRGGAVGRHHDRVSAQVEAAVREPLLPAVLDVGRQQDAPVADVYE